MHYLPDTNVLIAAMNGDAPAIDARLVRHRSDLALSAIVMHELYFGAFASTRIEHNLRRVAALGLPVLDFTDEDARVAGHIRADLRRAGSTPIGHYDLLIAGQALARDLTLVTNNIREFERVAGLRLEDWTAG